MDMMGDGEGQGIVMCFSPWDCKDSDMTERLNNSPNSLDFCSALFFCFQPRIFSFYSQISFP